MKKANRRSKQSSPVDASPSPAVNNQRQEDRIRELEQENSAFRKEIEELKNRLGNDSSSSNNGIAKIKDNYLGKLNDLEEQVLVLKKKLDSRSQFSTQKKGGDEASGQLQFEIQNLKAQKVHLQCKIKLESVQFRSCKASLEKEIHQLKKDGRRKQCEIHNLTTLNQIQKMVLQRKMKEASIATNRLKEWVESRKGAKNGTIPRFQGAEHELEDSMGLHELCSKYERQMEKMAEEIAKLKEENEMLKQENLRCLTAEKDVDCTDKDLEIEDLREQLNSLSAIFIELRVQKDRLAFKDKSQHQQQRGQPSAHARGGVKLHEEMDTPEMNHTVVTRVTREKTPAEVCCSCSKKSLCKTTKCQCRSNGSGCGLSCGCTHFKCTNRGGIQTKLNESPGSEVREESIGSNDGCTIAVQGAKLLESALAEKDAKICDNFQPKKPLCDIQNTMKKSDAQRPGQKKKQQKPVIELVTLQPPSSLPEIIPIEGDRNEAKANESAMSEVDGVPISRYPSRRGKVLNQKESY